MPLIKALHCLIFFIIVLSACKNKEVEKIESRVFSTDSDKGKKSWTVIADKWIWSDLGYALRVDEIQKSAVFQEMKETLTRKHSKNDLRQLEKLLSEKDPVFLANTYLTFLGKKMSQKKGLLFFKDKDWGFLTFDKMVICQAKDLICLKTVSKSTPKPMSEENSLQYLKKFYDAYDFYNLPLFCEDVAKGTDPIYQLYSQKVAMFPEGSRWSSLQAYCASIGRVRKAIRERL